MKVLPFYIYIILFVTKVNGISSLFGQPTNKVFFHYTQNFDIKDSVNVLRLFDVCPNQLRIQFFSREDDSLSIFINGTRYLSASYSSKMGEAYQESDVHSFYFTYPFQVIYYFDAQDTNNITLFIVSHKDSSHIEYKLKKDYERIYISRGNTSSSGNYWSVDFEKIYLLGRYRRWAKKFNNCNLK